MSEASFLEPKLKEGVKQLGLEIPVAPLIQYLSLLYKWNHAYNLTAVRDLDAMASRHVLDSLAVLPWVKGARWLDVGSGAGLPGIPLAIASSKTQVVLLDSNGKKTRFLREVKRALALDNVEIVEARVENYHPEQGFDTLLSRAFSDVKQMMQWTRHLVDENGIWLAMKSQALESELSDLHHAYRLEHYSVAGVERCCVIIEP